MSIPKSAVDSAEVPLRLSRLGLSEVALLDAVRAGYQEAATCTRHDPAILPGVLAWAKATAELRRLLTPQGWSMSSDRNFETVVSPDVAVAVARGTSETGRDGIPQTVTPRGPVTFAAVKRNRQLALAGFDDPEPDAPRRALWLLLHHLDGQKHEIRVELSRPSEIEGKRITSWDERLVLESIPWDADVGDAGDSFDLTEQPAGDENIDVDVRRRNE